jgi:predicted transcriptional regulator YheO
MVSNVIALRIDTNTSDLIEKLIRYKIATNRADALRWIMQNGMQNAKKTVDRKEKSQEIIKKWKEKGLPELPKDLSEISIKERD